MKKGTNVPEKLPCLFNGNLIKGFIVKYSAYTLSYHFKQKHSVFRMLLNADQHNFTFSTVFSVQFVFSPLIFLSFNSYQLQKSIILIPT